MRFDRVEKTYDGETLVVRDLDLDIAAGEFLTLLGPSGSGKTTTLMMLAGFEVPTRGTISVGGRDITRVPPHKRGLGMVFQNYALFPHMSVAENLAFPLGVRGISRESRTYPSGSCSVNGSMALAIGLASGVLRTSSCTDASGSSSR